MSIAQTLTSGNEYALILERDAAVAELARAQAGVTVCITTHNDADVLYGAVSSALNQSVPPVEVIIIDDGSDEPVICELLPKNETTLRVVRVTHRGLPAARNTAIMLTRTVGFLPLDADDRLAPTYIEETLPLLADADVVLAGLQEVGPHRNGRYNPGFDRPYDQVTEETLWEYNRYFYCSLFRTELLREVGGYHPAMAGWPGVLGGFEDWDLWLTLVRRGGVRFACVNEPLLLYNTATPGSMLARAESNRGTLVNEMRRHHRV